MSFVQQLYYPRNTTSDILSATYSIWNILNYVARTHDKKYRYQRGHIRPIQAEELLKIVRDSTQYCEIGFNAGHSTALALLANVKKVAVFDLMSFAYSRPALELLNESFNGRINVYEGRSSETLQKACKHHLKCDIAFVDGSHLLHEVNRDLKLLKCLIRDKSLLMIDDIQSPSGKAMETHLMSKKYRLVKKFGPFKANDNVNNPCMTTPYGPLCFDWGFAILQNI